MKLDKLTMSMALGIAISLGSHSSLANAPANNKQNDSVLSDSKSDLRKAKAKRIKKSSAKQNSVKTVASTKRNSELKKRNASKQFSSPVLAQSDTSYSPVRSSSRLTYVAPAKSDKKSKFSGSVDFTIGVDDNLGTDKIGLRDQFFSLQPTLGFSSGNWDGSFGASIKDYTDQNYSENYKEAQASAEATYTGVLSKITKSTTKLAAVYNDGREPDYVGTSLDGFDPHSDSNPGMSVRHTDVSLSQSLGFTFDSIQTELGGSILNRNSYNETTDFASDVFGENFYENDYNIIKGYGKVTLAAAKFLDLSAKPSISQKKYRSGTRLGRCPEGQASGVSGCSGVSASAYEHITSQVEFDSAFKFGKSSITPKAVIGVNSDEVAGAEDNSFYGFGISASFLLHAATELTLSPEILHRVVNYDNYTNGILTGQLREDNDTTGGIKASIKLAQNFKFGLAYTVDRQQSNKFADPTENYRQEIISSTFSFVF